MSKAVLVLPEMPESCWDCSICYDLIECLVVGKRTEMNSPSEDVRPDWCPLRPIPKKIPSREGMIKDEFKDGYRVGWNDAIIVINGSGE